MRNVCNNNQSLGKYLSTCRQDNGKSLYWSLENVALRAGITKTYLYKIEKDYPANVSTKVLKSLALILQTNYETLLHLAGHIDHNNFTKKKALEVPILGEIHKKETHITIYNKKILESVATENTFKEGKKLAGIRIKKAMKLNNYTLTSSDVLIIPLSHIEVPIDEITILRKFQ